MILNWGRGCHCPGGRVLDKKVVGLNIQDSGFYPNTILAQQPEVELLFILTLLSASETILSLLHLFSCVT